MYNNIQFILNTELIFHNIKKNILFDITVFIYLKKEMILCNLVVLVYINIIFYIYFKYCKYCKKKKTIII